jgi:Rps23 Pro-64 3,4-dihydroxylase Tpa1-like proline 4-hydroxylase
LVEETQVAGPIALFEINPGIDRNAAAERFAATGRVQIRDFLRPEAADTIHRVLSRETPWGLAWRAGEDGPHGLRRQAVAAMPPAARQAIGTKVTAAMQGKEYAFAYSQYAMLNAYLEKWSEHEALDLLVEHINSEPMMALVRQVTGIADLAKADAQATLYGPDQFLSLHDDSHKAEGWRIAYVMNFCAEEWRPDWGGYLLFFDEDGDVTAGYKPRFNALNMFRVPERHSVSYVPPFAPVARFAITGWFRDR